MLQSMFKLSPAAAVHVVKESSNFQDKQVKSSNELYYAYLFVAQIQTVAFYIYNWQYGLQAYHFIHITYSLQLRALISEQDFEKDIWTTRWVQLTWRSGLYWPPMRSVIICTCLRASALQRKISVLLQYASLSET